MIVLDTDTLTHLQLGKGLAYENLVARLTAQREPVAVTVVSFDEQARGRLAQVARAQSSDELVNSYARLRELLDAYRSLVVLDFDRPAVSFFRQVVQHRLRVGTMDLRIAAIALSRDAMLVSRNLRDFRRVPGLRVEDWTA